jgi:class 3 adenylate cyclase/tetratricopeptide (TPR) repeat protein
MEASAPLVCPACGTGNRPDRKYCAACGSSLAIRCPACGSSNLPGEWFCGECGTALAPGAPAPEDRADGPPAPGGTAASTSTAAERRLVTVLFADLVGFTALAESRDMESVRDLQTAYFDASRSVIERHGGAVEKYIGDAVMAIWGAPIAREDDVERAVRAGLDLVDAVAGLGERDGHIGLSARVGLVTGEAAVTVGAIGQGMVTGDIVNTAARLQGAADPGTVLAGEATVRASEAAIVYEAIGELTLKGKALPVPAWRATRIVAGRGGLGRAAADEAPFVGRGRELRALKDALQAVTDERHATLVDIVGQAGIGKSRLAWEFEKHVDGLVQSVYWHRGRSPAYGDGVAYWALGEMVRERARIAETDSPADSEARLESMLTEYVPDVDDRRWVATHVRALLGLGTSTGTDRNEQFAAWRRLFESITERGTTVLVFEDLQWADDGLLDFIESLLEWSRAHPILVIALTRPELLERRPTFGTAGRNTIRIHLDPLSDEESRTLLRAIAPDLPEALESQVVARAAGIPLYAIELVRMLRAADGSIPATDPGSIAIPPSLQALVTARLDALGPDDRTILQDAAVLGQTFTIEALSSVSGRSQEVLGNALGALVRREYLVLDVDPRSSERGQYGFVQSMLREVAYGTLGRRDRRARHLAAARHFETLDDEEIAPVLAAHYLEAYRASPDDAQGAAIRVQARLAVRAAAERAARLHNSLQAIRDLDTALELAEDDVERAALYERQAALAEAAAELDLGIERAERARAIHESLGDAAGVTRAVTLIGSMQLKGGQVAAAMERLGRAIEGIDAEADPAAYATVAALIGRGHMLSGEGPSAITWTERALAAAGPIRLVEVIAEALNTRGVALEWLGRMDESIALLGAAADLASAHHLSNAELRARYNLAGRAFGDRPQEAIANLQVARDLASRVGRRDWQLLTGGLLLGLLRGAGRWDEALAVFDELTLAALHPEARTSCTLAIGYIEAARGTRPFRETIAEIDAFRTAESAGPQEMSERAAIALEAAVLEGRLGDADALVAVPMVGTYAVIGASRQAQLAIIRRDVERARAVLADPAWTAEVGAISTAWRGLMASGIAALEGRRDEAVSGFRASLGWFRDNELWWFLGDAEITAAHALGPDDPESRVMLAESRAIWERLQAVRFLEWIDRLEAEVQASPTAPGAGTPLPVTEGARPVG